MTHKENCDALGIGPDLEPSTKPCNCSTPKFKVGQVVAFTTMRGSPVFRIMQVMWSSQLGDWSYRFSRQNWASQDMLRELTPEEKGIVEKMEARRDDY